MCLMAEADAFLHSDNRFILTGSETKSYECIVTVKRKKL